jgi:pyruvate kinase
MAKIHNFAPLIESLKDLHRSMAGVSRHPMLEGFHPSRLTSARNLLQYLVFRQKDLRAVQRQLMELGLSSLGRSEAHILYSLDRVLETSAKLAGEFSGLEDESAPQPDFDMGRDLLEKNTEAIWPAPKERWVRIMVTMPSEAAKDPKLIKDLLKEGMDCMRVNCAHDGPEAWGAMIRHLRKAQKEIKRPCQVLMDLAGPKLRTGAIQEGPRVLKWKPKRDAMGRVLEPARVWLYDEKGIPEAPEETDACLPVPAAWLERLGKGDLVEFHDSREAKREMRVLEKFPKGRLAESEDTAYIVPGLELKRVAPKKNKADLAKVGQIPAWDSYITLRKGDQLWLTKSQTPGKPGVRDRYNKMTEPAVIPCTLPEVFQYLKPGEKVVLDDGKIVARILTVGGAGALLEVTLARPEGDKLKAEKGINFPDSELKMPALSPKDLKDLEFVAEKADCVSLSFAQSADDVADLQKRLKRLDREDMAIVLKIETKRGFEHLPAMLLNLLRWSRGAVMIARGDLAVECGYERLAEVQEELLWICEAAHVPTIWATQVLETLARTGRPSRSEITDAAMGERAECVMLNNGPYILDALRFLDDILRRMQTHQRKKAQMLRQLKSWSLS